MTAIEYDVFSQNYLIIYSGSKYEREKRTRIDLGDKVIVKMNTGEVFQGEVSWNIGKKYIWIRTYPIERFGCKSNFNHRKITISDIYKIAKFPKDSQKLDVMVYR